MDKVAVFIKSYRRDIVLVAKLLDSIERYNVDGIGTWLAVPEGDLALFGELGSREGVTLISESVFGVSTAEERIHGLRLGFVEQSMIKLSLHRLGVADNYVIMDSDCYFIRPFYISDFVDDSGHGYTVLSEDKDNMVVPWFTEHLMYRLPALNKIADYFELPKSPRPSSEGHLILRADVLQDIETWIRENNLTQRKLMELAALESSWYNFYMQKMCPEKIVRIEPFIRFIHTREEYRAMLRQGYTTELLAKAYVGVCVNTTWAGRTQRLVRAKLERGSLVATINNCLLGGFDYVIINSHRLKDRLFRPIK
jgi:predicted XRE-type DNA-binding protein